MDIKGIIFKQIENQIESSVPEIKDGINSLIIEKIQSEEFEKRWATALNKKINLPGISEAAEQRLYELMIDKGTDLVAGVMKEVLDES